MEVKTQMPWEIVIDKNRGDVSYNGERLRYVKSVSVSIQGGEPAEAKIGIIVPHAKVGLDHNSATLENKDDILSFFHKLLEMKLIRPCELETIILQAEY